MLVVKVGDDAIPGVTFTALKDPVLNADGAVAFSATLKGVGIKAASKTAIFTNAFPGGALTLVAQTGDVADTADGARLNSFASLSLQGAEVLYVAKLNGGHPVVTGANNLAAYSVTAAGTTQVVRTGQDFATTKVKTFSLLGVSAGSPGENRAHTEGGAAFLVLLADKTQALVDSAGGVLTPFATTGTAIGGTVLPEATFQSFGPVAAPDAAFSAVLATLTANAGGVTKTTASGIFLGDGSAFEPIARAGDATGIADVVFGAFNDPVLALGTSALAFPATLKGAVKSSNNASLWWQPAAGPLTLFAREGDEPAETGAGVKWKAFKSLAISGGENGAPLFYATLSHGKGVSAKNDAGLWAVDSTDTLRLIAREGDVIDGKKLKAITVLTAVPGSTGVTRSFNNAGQIIYRATFTDASTAIVTVQLP